ncbi:hypothetical protein IMG5_143490 [Ichthyophthirius multifiliis]|uniref:Cytochrome b5 domain-containing protein 1 n=1 Tax=Ichthyophthirius multifiliis TaxID=5932 RepID=G0QXK1_ICHMU|nr:hypothetical protein IMG5_143490 [Ichthyophthirius multifiliis]EGR30055.1 hypothetical protein IMG5_143490 [Ichthyophthirius multifiliis]|eukprot:XP_004031291.1 hypothetical protein IMG5_143490 [Ichthyophthirius multifiliis]
MSQKDNLIQYLPVPYKKKRFYTLQDLKLHNTANDCWITFFNQIYDITALIQQNINSPFIKPLIEAAGSDITYWFDPLSKDPRVQIDLNTGLEKFYCPQGIFLHIQPSGPENINLVEDLQTPWWKNPIFFIGRLTIRSSKINIINMLTQHEDLIEVPCEETINEILERYKQINAHAASYTWKRLGRPLDMELNLEENNIIDQTAEFERLGIPENEWYWPTIHLYFNDDLTVL